MAADVKVDEKPSLCLDSSGCVSLLDILVAFNAPISEEHAWALCYECIKCFQNALQEQGKCLVVSEPEHVILHKDGQVHPRTILNLDTSTSAINATKNDESDRTVTTSEQKLVFHLGITLFKALEFGFQEEEERRLGADLERLIDLMTAEEEDEDDNGSRVLCLLADALEGSADTEVAAECHATQHTTGEEAVTERPETDDEGIEQDSGEGAEESGAAPRSSAPGSVPGSSHHQPPESGPLHAVLTRVLEHCTARQQSGQRAQAEAHYRAVCRALVAEALELASFLERVSQGTQKLPCVQVDSAACRDLDQLKFTDWSGRRIWRALQARLWMQVIQELRHGVQLKKVREHGTSVTPSAHSIEYELTPYEILMDDIRARRYKLNKVMVDGEIPQRVKKDAHAIILEFIRSRPPLRKASERQLAPAPNRASSPRELLMESIKQEHRLRPSSPAKRPFDTSPSQTALLQEPKREPEGTPMRRLIQVDFSEFQLDLEDDDDEDLVCSIESPTSPTSASTVLNGSAASTRNPNPWRRTDSSGSKGEPGTPSAVGSHLKLRYDLGDLLAGSRASGFLKGEATSPNPTEETTARPASLLLDSYDLATQCPSRRSTLRRRHTVATGAEGASEEETALNGEEAPVRKVPRPLSTERGEEAEEEDDTHTHTSLGSCELNWSRSSLQDEFLQSTHWQSAMECLSLTLEEIVHIRSVLTKAELESLPVEGRIKEEVEKRKVCFLCLKTRFSIFGPWGQKCKLCKRTVCTKCCSKMRIPTEHFSRVPVFALSPGLSSPEGSEDGSSSPTLARSLMTRLLAPSNPPAAPIQSEPLRNNSVGSAPTSPNLTRRTKPSSDPPRASLSPSPSQQFPSMSPVNEEQPQSLPAVTTTKPTPAQRGKLLRSKTLGRPAVVASTTVEKLRGLQMTVCLDCKAMVLQIIKTSRTSRTHAIKNLSLNLSPVY